MTKQRAPFMHVTPDVDDSELERLAAEKGVGALVKPSEQTPRAGEGSSTPEKPIPQPAVRERKMIANPATGATPRDRMKTVNLELPDYVWTDLKIRAAHAQTSVRHIVMMALKANGIMIAEADMVEDGRKLRS